MKNFGYSFSLILLNIKKFSKANQEKMREFSKDSKYVTSFNLSLIRPNCILNLFHENEKQLRNTVQEIKDIFKNESMDIDVMLLGEDEIEIRTLPFL